MELKDIKGIKEKRLSALESVGVNTTSDLLNMLPVKYLDMTKIATADELVDGAEVLIKATVVGEPFNLYYSKVKTTKVKIDTGEKKMFAMWFNQPYMKNNLQKDERYIFYGKIKDSGKGMSLLSPMFEREDNASRLFGIVPKYQKIEGVPQSVIESAVKDILEKEEALSVFDGELFDEIELKEGYKKAHFPTSLEEAKEGARRIFVEKIVRMILSYRLSGKIGNRKDRKYKDIDVIAKMQSILPFDMTESQIKAIKEIEEDMQSGTSMNRLLQGDVGSGKTVVIMAACLIAAMSGYTSAVMCPTTTLASQHFKTFKETLGKIGIRVCNVSSGSEFDNCGDYDVYVGTHALFSEKVDLKDLAFVAIDEQQKFGVSARAKLAEKGFSVDVLSLTATPIPRTLSLILYGTLSISYLNSRKESIVKTRIVSEKKQNDMFKFIEKMLDEKGLCYVVCRKIDTSETTEEEGAEEKYKEIKRAFPTKRVRLLHGRMPIAERSKTVNDFLNNKIDILVSTSVIEVGIDNPRANAIVIYGAENFGLSSLHQLRGRVGRQGQESWCFLVPNGLTEKQKERLDFFKNNTDGFKIADYDLETRGAGDVYGVRQHGNSAFSSSFSGGFDDIRRAKEIADEIELETLSEERFQIITGIENKAEEKVILN